MPRCLLLAQEGGESWRLLPDPVSGYGIFPPSDAVVWRLFLMSGPQRKGITSVSLILPFVMSCVFLCFLADLPRRGRKAKKDAVQEWEGGFCVLRVRPLEGARSNGVDRYRKG